MKRIHISPAKPEARLEVSGDRDGVRIVRWAPEGQPRPEITLSESEIAALREALCSLAAQPVANATRRRTP